MIAIRNNICYDSALYETFNYLNSYYNFDNYYKLLYKNKNSYNSFFKGKIFFSFANLNTDSLYDSYDSLFFIVESFDSKGLFCREIKANLVLTNYIAKTMFSDVPVASFTIPSNFKLGKKFRLNSLVYDSYTNRFFTKRGEVLLYNSSNQYLGKCGVWFDKETKKQQDKLNREKMSNTDRVVLLDNQVSIDSILAKNIMFNTYKSQKVALQRGMVFYSSCEYETRHREESSWKFVKFFIIIDGLKNDIVLCEVPSKIKSFNSSSRKNIPAHWGVSTLNCIDIHEYIENKGVFAPNKIVYYGEGSYDITGDTFYLEPDISVLTSSYIKAHSFKIRKASFEVLRDGSLFYKGGKNHEDGSLFNGTIAVTDRAYYYDYSD